MITVLKLVVLLILVINLARLLSKEFSIEMLLLGTILDDKDKNKSFEEILENMPEHELMKKYGKSLCCLFTMTVLLFVIEIGIVITLMVAYPSVITICFGMIMLFNGVGEENDDIIKVSYNEWLLKKRTKKQYFYLSINVIYWIYIFGLVNGIIK